MTCYELRGKGNSAIDIKFVSWNNKKVEIKNDVVEDVPKETRTKKVLKKGAEVKTESLKNAKIYLDVNIDNSVIDLYKNPSLNILEISKQIDIKPFQVVSILMKHNIIETRGDARGYDLYKETDEYKDKIVKK